MKFHINIKFRAFGVTFGSLDEKVDGSQTLGSLVRALMPLIAKSAPAAALIDPTSLLSQIQIPPHVIYNDRGVLFEIVSG